MLDKDAVDRVPVGTLGGGRETFDGFPLIASVTLRLLDASSVCRLSYETKFGCEIGGIVLEWTVDLQTRIIIECISKKIVKQMKPFKINTFCPKNQNLSILTYNWMNSQIALPWKGDMLPLWRNDRSTFTTMFLEIGKLLSELTYSTAVKKYVIYHHMETAKSIWNNIVTELVRHNFNLGYRKFVPSVPFK